MNFAPQADKLTSYYRWHAPFYDATRWSFLFGRGALIRNLPPLPKNPRILEIGCGTGRNLKAIKNLYSEANIIGVDVSRHMLAMARRKKASQHFNLIEGSYGYNLPAFQPFDLIVLSYSMTMMGSSIDDILQQTERDLTPGGHIAVVDFHHTSWKWFRQWMGANHVQMDGTLLPKFKKSYLSLSSSVHQAYLGIWSYFLFVGRKK